MIMLTDVDLNANSSYPCEENGGILRFGRMLSFEIVEVNPVIDGHNRTGDLAVELALPVFGKKILWGLRSKETL